MRWALALMAFGACRLDFSPVATGAKDAAPEPDGPVVYNDAPLRSYCTPLGVAVTAEQCAAARADPANAPDQVLYDCADACALRGCVLFEGPKDGCSTCACNTYIKSSVICDASGLCGPPLNGTGCFSAGSFTQAPFNCPSTATVQETLACALRVLMAMNDC